MEQDRLSRLEGKIDQLQEAVIKLARVEERLITVFNRQSIIEQKVDHLEVAISDIKQSIAGRFAERVFWVLFATLATLMSNYL